MSSPNAARSLPPGDRDDAPDLALPPASWFDGLSLPLDAIEAALTQGAVHHRALTDAIARGNLRDAETAADALACALMPDTGAMSRVIAKIVRAAAREARRQA